MFRTHSAVRKFSFWPSPGVFVLALAAVHGMLLLRDIDLKVAGYSVSSPLGYLWLGDNPSLASHDWPAGSADFRFSLPMQLLRWVHDLTKADPAALLWPFGFLSIVFMLLTIAHLAQVLFRHSPTTIAITVIMAASPVAGINLGNFGAGIGLVTPVLFYDVAHGFSFLALALFLTGRPVWAATFAAAATASHLTIGLYLIFFIGAGLFATPRRLLEARVLLAIAVYAALILPVLLQFVTDSTIEPDDVPRAQWVLMSRLFNWHWHPIELGLFGPLGFLGIVPLAMTVAGYAIARLAGQSAAGGADGFLAGGMIGVAVLGLFGILLSDVWHVPFIMKLAPQRATEFLSITCLFYLVRFLVSRLDDGGLVEAALAAWTIAVLIVAAPGLAVLPIALLGTMQAIHFGRTTLTAFLISFLLLLLVSAGISTLALGTPLSPPSTWQPILSSWMAKAWAPLTQLTPFNHFDLLIFGGAPLAPDFAWIAIGLSAALVGGSRLSRTKAHSSVLRAGIMAGLLGVVLGVAQHQRWSDWAISNRARWAAFKDVQLWAAKNTAPTATFLLDPSYATGWREYSGRASYGSLSELAHFATLYDSVPGLFQKGLARVREFGVDPLAVDPAAITLATGGKYGISVLAPRVSATFYSMSGVQLAGVAMRHHVTHIVLERAKRAEPLDGLQKVYGNAQYDVYTVPGAAQVPVDRQHP